MVEIAIIFALLVFLLGFLVFLLVAPIWLLVHCVNNREVGKTKTIWILTMLLLWPFAEFLYGFLYLKNKFWKWISGGAFALSVIGTLTFIFLFPVSLAKERQNMKQTIVAIDQVSMGGTLPNARDVLKGALKTLEGEIQGMGFLRIEEVQIVRDLHLLLRKYLADGELSAVEYQGWIEKYRMRKLLSHEAMEQFLIETR